MSNFLSNIWTSLTFWASESHSFERGKETNVNIWNVDFLGVTPFIFLSLCSHMLPDRLSKGEEVSWWLKFYFPGMLIFSQTCRRIAVGLVKTQSAHDSLPAFVGQRSAEPSFLTRIISLPQIFFFCFNFLKHIVSEKFSAVKKQRWVCLFLWRESIFHSF